ncbi:MAG: hypothetical protein SPD47_09660 [Oscillospiraceae bacterium]|nr:hypothetical protein [Oscillospiraceae bacterium]
MKKSTFDLGKVIAQRKHFRKQVKTAKSDQNIAERQGIKSADSFSDWSHKELSPTERLKGLYVLSSLGSFNALEWLIDEAYGKSRIGTEKGKRKALRKKARKYLSSVAIRPHLSEMKEGVSRSWLIRLGDYHLGLLGNVKNSSLAWASRYYAMAALSNKDDVQLKLKLQCVKLLMCQISKNDFKALMKYVGEYDFVTYAVALFFLGAIKAKKKKHGKHFKYYKSMVISCLDILQYTEGRYVNHLFKAVSKSKLFK